MRIRIIFLLAFPCLFTGAFAQPWQAPRAIRSFDNIEFYGNGFRSISGNTLLAYTDQIDEVQKTRFTMFNDALEPLLDQSLSVKSYDYSYSIVPASDGNYIQICRRMSELRAYKTSPSGAHLWDSEGVVFWTGDYFSTSEFITRPDNAGGVYIGWAVDGFETEELATIQHLDSNGEISMATNGYAIDDPAPNYLTDFQVLPDNDVLLSYISRGSHRIRRLTPSGSTIWDIAQEISIPSSMLPDGSLCLLEDGSFVAGTAQRNHIGLQRYQLTGEAVWDDPVLVLEFPDQINRVKLFRSSDNGIFVAATNLSGSSLNLQKANSNGELSFSQDLTIVETIPNLVWNLYPGPQGDCYISYSAQGLDYIQVLHILAEGSTQWSLPAMSGMYTARIQPAFYGDFLDGKFQLFWRDRRSPQSGIYVQKFYPDGSCQYQTNGRPLITGPHGFIYDFDLATVNDQTCMVWCEQEESYQAPYLKIQISGAYGSTIFPSGGAMLYSDEVAYCESPQVSKYGNDFLVTWSCVEYGSSGTIINFRAQLIDQNGVFLWNESGISICPGAHKFVSNVVDGNLFTFWYTIEDSLSLGHIQKYVNGTPQYPPEGLTITQSPLNASPYLASVEAFTGPYIISKFPNYFFGPGLFTVLRIEADGTLSPGFGSSGNQVIPVSTDYNQTCYSTCLVGDKLLLCMRNGADRVLQLVSPSGELEYGDQGLQCVGNELIAVAAGPEYFTLSEPDTSFKITKRHVSGGLIWQRTIHPQPPLQAESVVEAFYRLDAESFIVVYKDGQYPSSARWFYLDGEGMPTSPVSSEITSNQAYFTCSIDANGSGLSFAWVKLEKQLCLFRINHQPGNSVPDAPFLELSLPYPNPFRADTQIMLKSDETTETEVSVYNLRGQLLKRIFKGIPDKGKTELSWDGTNSKGKPVAKGLYLIKAESGKLVRTQKVIKQ